jgi:hypothetical protein
LSIGAGGIALTGQSIVFASWLFLAESIAGASIQLLSITSGEPSVLPIGVLSISATDVEGGCGCGKTPPILYMRHGLGRSSEFNSFLGRNMYFLPEEIVLRFNAIQNTWRQNYSFRGVGLYSQEIWNILFEWGCTAAFDGTNSDGPLWKFSFYANRRNTVTGEDFDTRIICTFDSASPCVGGILDFAFSIDTSRQGQVVASSPPSSADSIVFLDETGMFVSRAWLSQPVLPVTIRQVARSVIGVNFDISSIFPAEPMTKI